MGHWVLAIERLQASDRQAKCSSHLENKVLMLEAGFHLTVFNHLHSMVANVSSRKPTIDAEENWIILLRKTLTNMKADLLHFIRFRLRLPLVSKNSEIISDPDNKGHTADLCRSYWIGDFQHV